MGCITCSVNRKWFFLIALAIANLTCALCASIQAPFYPREAEKKGASATEYGFVFGIFELVGFLTGPLFGKYVCRMDPACMLKIGIIVTGTSTCLFGLLDMINDHTWFITLSFILRITESLGTCAIVTSTLSLVAIVYIDAYARVFSVIEVLRGLGIMLGPTFGGFLFEYGKFPLPFFVVGLGVLTSGILILIFLPKIESDGAKNKPTGNMWQIMKIPSVFIDMVSLAVQATTVSFIETTLEPHLREFHLSSSKLGAMFMIHSLLYSLMSPIVGVLCDKGWSLRRFTIIGCVATTAGVLLIGPMPYVPLKLSLWMVGVAMGTLGFGMALVYVPAMIDANYQAMQNRKQEDITTYGAVSGIIISSFCLGSFTGPSVAGVLVDTVGFRKGTLFLIVINILVVIMVTWLSCTRRGYVKLQEKESECSTNSPNNSTDTALQEIPRQESELNSPTTSESPEESCDPRAPILTESSVKNYYSIQHEQSQ